MISYSNVSAGKFRVYVGEGNKNDSLLYDVNISKNGRIRQTYVSKGSFKFIDIENNVDKLVTTSINALSDLPQYQKLNHLTKIQVLLEAQEDNSQFLCVTYKNKKNVKEVLLQETELAPNFSTTCFKNDFVLIKSEGDFILNNIKLNNTFYAYVRSEEITINAIHKTKVVRFYV
jgi:aspartokinase